jgi:hypothetical protein
VVRRLSLGVSSGGESHPTGGGGSECRGNPNLRSEQLVGHPLAHGHAVRGRRFQAGRLKPDHRGRFAGQFSGGR